MPESEIASESSKATTLRAGRWLVVACALLWSLSGLFVKAPLFDEWRTEKVWGELTALGPIMAFWRAIFAGLVLLPLASKPRWNARYYPMVACFAVMNVTYLSAVALTTSANAIWLQSTAPLWVFLWEAVVHRRFPARRDAIPLVFGFAGIAVILACEIQHGASMDDPTAFGRNLLGIACGVASGVLYAGVVLCMRSMRDENTAWLVVVNHFVTAALVLPALFVLQRWPNLAQVGTLALFGVLQMGLPYWLFGLALRRIPSQEATAIGLLEPTLMPLWTFLAWSERPHWWTILGGGLIFLGLLVRYGLPILLREGRER